MKNKQSGVPKPAAMELAKLSAILRPSLEPKAALKTAMEFYVEAALFLRELPSTSEDDLIRKFGSRERKKTHRAQPFHQLDDANWADTLELDPKKHHDDARRFLAELGLPLKTARGVINNVRRHLEAIQSSDTYGAKTTFTWEQVMLRLIRMKDGRHISLTPDELLQRLEKDTLKDGEIYAIPRFMLKTMVPYAKWRRKEQQRRSSLKPKSRKKPERKSVKENLKKSSVESAAG